MSFSVSDTIAALARRGVTLNRYQIDVCHGFSTAQCDRLAKVDAKQVPVAITAAVYACRASNVRADKDQCERYETRLRTLKGTHALVSTRSWPEDFTLTEARKGLDWLNSEESISTHFDKIKMLNDWIKYYTDIVERCKISIVEDTEYLNNLGQGRDHRHPYDVEDQAARRVFAEWVRWDIDNYPAFHISSAHINAHARCYMAGEPLEFSNVSVLTEPKS